MTSVTIIGPPESNGGVGQYTSDFANAHEGKSCVRRFDVGFNPVSHLRLAVAATSDDTEAIHVQFVYSFLGSAGVLTALFFPILYLLTRLYSKRLVVTLHEVWDETDVDSSARQLYAYFTHTMLLACTDHVTFLSENAQNMFRLTSFSAETWVVPHGVNLEATQQISNARSRFSLDEDDFVVSQPGYVNPRKGVETFLAIAEKLPEYEFLLAGGPRVDEHEAYFKDISENAPENVTITGILDETEFHAVFNATDLVVLPYEEINQSGVFNWCAAYGVPTITTQITYFEDIRREWGCPETFQQGDLEQAVEAIEQSFEVKTKRDDMSECMMRYAKENSMIAVSKQFDTEFYCR